MLCCVTSVAHLVFHTRSIQSQAFEAKRQERIPGVVDQITSDGEAARSLTVSICSLIRGLFGHVHTQD